MTDNLKPVGLLFQNTDLDRWFAELVKVNTAMDKMAGETAKSGKKINKTFDDIGQGIKLGLGIGIADAATRATSAVVGFFTGSIDKAGQFESAMNRFGSVVGSSLQSSGKDLQTFNDLFLKLGQDTKYSAQEAADAAVELAKGGRDAGQVYAELGDVLALASAGELDLAKAAELSAKQLAIWEDTGVKATDVSNLLAQAANASTVGVEDLGVGLANVGGVAKVAGLTFEETVTALAQLAPGFSSASDAGTSFKAFLNTLQPTTDPATKAMKELGLFTEGTGSVFYDQQGNFVGMTKASELLHTATKDLSQAEKALALETIFGADAQRAAAILAEDGAAGYTKMAGAMDKAGSATEQADKKNQGYQANMDQLKGSLETLQIIIGTKLLPVITDMVKGLTKIVNGIVGIVEAIDQLDKLGDKLQETNATVISGADNWEDYNKRVTFTNAKLMAIDSSVTRLNRSQFEYARSLQASGMGARELDDALVRTNDTAQRIDRALIAFRESQTAAGNAHADALDNVDVSLLKLAGTSDDYKAKVSALLDIFEAGGYDALPKFQQGLAELEGKSNRLAIVTEINSRHMSGFSSAAKAATTNVGGLNQALSPTEEQMKRIVKIQEDAIKALGSVQEGRVAFLADTEKRQKEHNDTLQRLQDEYNLATEETDKQRIAEQIAQQIEGNTAAELADAESYARRQAALNAALGEQLIAYVQTQNELGLISDQEAQELSTGITTQYGVAADSMVLLFGEMKTKIDEAAKEGKQNTSVIVTGLGEIQAKAVAFEQEFNRRLTAATAELVQMKNDGKITIDEYSTLLAGIETEVRTELKTEFEKAYAITQIQLAHEQATQGGKEVGKAFSDGLTAGINANKGTVALAARGSVAEAIAAAKREGLISSPSRRTAEEVGRPLAEGIAVGFEQGTPSMLEAIGVGLDAVGGALGDRVGMIVGDLQRQFEQGMANISARRPITNIVQEGGLGVGTPGGNSPALPRGIQAFGGGGRYQANKPMVVGEYGWEVLVPDSAGQVYNQRQLAQMVSPPPTAQQISQASYEYNSSRSMHFNPVYNVQQAPPMGQDASVARTLQGVWG